MGRAESPRNDLSRRERFRNSEIAHWSLLDRPAKSEVPCIISRTRGTYRSDFNRAMYARIIPAFLVDVHTVLNALCICLDNETRQLNTAVIYNPQLTLLSFSFSSSFIHARYGIVRASSCVFARALYKPRAHRETMNDERWAASGKEDKLVPNETRARIILMALRADIVQLVRLLLDVKRKKDFMLHIFYDLPFFFLFFVFVQNVLINWLKYKCNFLLLAQRKRRVKWQKLKLSLYVASCNYFIWIFVSLKFHNVSYDKLCNYRFMIADSCRILNFIQDSNDLFSVDWSNF